MIKQRMRELGLTQNDVALALNISRPAVSLMLSGKRKMSAQEAMTLSELLGVDNLGVASRKLPVIGWVSAGAWREAVEVAEDMIISPDVSLSAEAFVLVVEGDSMDQVAPDGAHVVVDPQDRELITGRSYIVRNGDGDVTFKRFASEPARLEPVSSNTNHRTIQLGQDAVEVIGRVIWVMQRM